VPSDKPSCRPVADPLRSIGGLPVDVALGGALEDLCGRPDLRLRRPQDREDVGVEGDPVDDRGDQAGVGEDGAPFIRGWHVLILNYSGCCLGNLRSGVSADL
jgi:hypothetical protein